MQETIYVVQTFREEGGKLVPVTPISAKTEREAKERARSMRHKSAGVVAFSRTGDAETGDYDDPVILAKFGKVPPEVDEL